jgi:hypothetical protein
MAALPYSFKDFLTKIRPTKAQREGYRDGHKRLTDRLNADEGLKPVIVSTFLQGSYRRSTGVRPFGDGRPDVDVIAVTRLSSSQYSPQQALDLFIPFLERHYEGKWEQQGRSIGIELSKVKLDLVVTSAPEEAEEGILLSEAVTLSRSVEDLEAWDLGDAMVKKSAAECGRERAWIEATLKRASWQLSPLEIPDREVNSWQDTHPLAQIDWTIEKNAATNQHYVNVVKALKWWRKVNYTTPKYPKGYPLEHLIGQCCADGISSVAEGVTRTLEEIRERYETQASLGISPYLQDHGVAQDVFHRVTGEEFTEFHGQVTEAAENARRAYDAEDERESAEAWIELFGDRFPKPPPGGDGSKGSDGGSGRGGYTPRDEPSRVGKGRFA